MNLKSLVKYILPAGILLIIYWPALNGGFVFDDYRTLHENDALRLFPQAFQAFWLQNLTRVLTYCSLTFEYRLFKFNAWGYHTVALGMHFINALLVYLLLKIFANPEISDHRPQQTKPFTLSGALALIFLFHPLQTQAVNYISQRGTLIAALFCLSALYTFLKYKQTSVMIYRILSFVFTIAAMFTKENCFMLPAALLLADTVTSQETSFKDSLQKHWPYLLTMLLIPASLLIGQMTGRNLAGVTQQTLHISRTDYFLTQIHAIYSYVKLFVWPAGLNIDHDYPLYLAHGLSLTMAKGLGLVCVIALAVKYFSKFPLISYGVLFFFLMMSIESSVIPIDDVFQEYRMYLPLFGILLTLAGVIRRTGYQKLLLGTLSLIICACGVLTYQRNLFWENEVVLLEEAYRLSPRKMRLQLNLVRAHLRAENFDKAHTFLKMTITANPKNRTYDQQAIQMYNNSPGIESFLREQIQHNDLRSILQLGKYLYLENTDPKTLTNTANVLCEKYDTLAYALYVKTLALDPTNQAAYLGLANLAYRYGSLFMADYFINLAEKNSGPLQEETKNLRKLLTGWEGY